MALIDRDETWRTLKPFVAGLIDDKIADVTSSSGVAVAAHDLGGSRHTGTLNSSQAPQFLLRDGSRSLTGNLAVGSTITIDGVDIDVFKAAYDAHIANPDAHHLGFVGLTADSGSAAPNASDLILIAGGNGLASSASGTTLTLNMDTPTTLTVATTNAAGTGHTHAITSSSNPGPSASLLATAASGNLNLGTTLLSVDVANTRMGVGMAPTAARLDVTGGASEAAARIQSSVTTANAMEWLATALTTGALVNATLPAARTVLQARVSGDTVPRMALSQTGLLFGSGSANPDVVLRRSGANTLVADDNALGGAVDLAVSRKGTFGSITPGTAMLTAINPGGEQLRLAYDGLNYAGFSVGAGGNLTMTPTGDVIFDPTGNDILPQSNYDLNLGAINKKYLTLHAAELWVETLVAQDTLATIGGRVLVGPTTQLTSDLAASGTDQTIARRSSSSASGSSASPLVSAPAGATSGDVLLVSLVVGAGTGTTITAVPANARLLRSTANTANTAQLLTYAVPCTPTVPTLSFTLSGSAAWVVGVIAYQNVQLAIVDNITTFQANASSTSIAAPAMNTTVTTTMLVFVGGTAAATTVTPPSGMTEVLDVAGTGITLEMAELIQAGTGTTGTQTATAVAAASNAAHLIALTPRVTSSVVVKHNQMRPGDVVIMEAAGFVEFMSVVSGPSGSGPYTYTMARDLDGTGANPWNAGDALFNTGQAGSGFIDLYSLYGLGGEPLDFLYNFDTDLTAYSANLASDNAITLFGNNANTAINDAMYFGVQSAPWNNLYFNLATAGVYTATIVWEYWNGSAWTAFTPTVTPATPLFQATGSWSIEWMTASLSGWAATTINSQTAYWVRARISAFTSFATPPVTSQRRVYWRRRTTGPTIVGNVRNSSTYNDWSEHWAIGNLNGLYDYGTEVYGFAAGKWSGTAGTTPWISADATSGFRVMRGSTKLAQWDTAGAITIGQVAASQGNVFLSSGGVQTRTNTTVKFDAQADGDIFIGTNTGAAATTFFSLFATAQTYNAESMAVGDVLMGDNSASKANIKWTPANGRLNFRGGTTTQLYIATDGSLTFGGGNGVLDSTGMRLTTYAGSLGVLNNANAVRWVTGAQVEGYIQTTYSSGALTRSLQLAVPATGLATTNVTRITLSTTATSGADNGVVSLIGGNASSSSSFLVTATDIQFSGGIRTGAAAVASFGNINMAGVLYPSNQTTYYLEYNATVQAQAARPGLQTNGNLGASGAVIASDWFRSVGATGWYSQTYGGGLYMQNTTSVEVYGGKYFYAPTGLGIGVDPTVFAGSWRAGIQGATAAAGQYALVVRNSTPTNLMYCENNGALWANVAWTISDAREKHAIQNLSSFRWDDFMQLRPVEYIRNISGLWEVGLIAQETQHIPHAVTVSGLDERLGISQMTILTHAIAAIQDLKATVAALEARLS